MASVKIKFRPSSVDGREGSVYFKVIHRRASRIIGTGCHLRAEEWDETASAVRMDGAEDRRARLELVAYKLRWGYRQLTGIIAAKEAAMDDYTVDDIVAEYAGLPPCQTWFGFIRAMADKKARAKRAGTAKTYRDALASFACFRGGEDMAVDALDGEVIARYEAWLKHKGLKRNSSSCYLRTLKTLYRKAVDTGLACGGDIFSRVYTGFAATTKRAIPLEQVRAIRRLRLAGGSPLAFARDVFMLSLYLQGMAFVDMAYLRKTDIRSGQLQYVRKKTRQTLTVGWERAMQDIVDRYSALTRNTPYLLPIITRQDGTERRQYERMEHNVNRNLKKIGEMAGLHIPLTTYVARHTWASSMRDMGNDISIISRGLGHENIKTTQIYLSTIDTATVMKANRRMIDRILK